MKAIMPKRNDVTGIFDQAPYQVKSIMDMPWDSRDLQIFGDDDKLIGIPDSIKPSFDKEKAARLPLNIITLTFNPRHRSN